MTKKKIEDTKPIPIPPPAEETKPVQVKRTRATKITEPVSVQEPDNSIPTAPEIPSEPEKKPRRAKWIWLGILAMLLITAAGAGIGYFLAMQARQAADTEQRLTAANEQYARALLDQEAGNFTMAKQRYEYVLQIYPQYPDIDKKLVEIGVLIAQQQGITQLVTPLPNQPTQSVVIVVPTKDTKSAPILLKQAQDQLTANDWTGLYATVSSLRDIDPTYEPIKVDGLYYAALRNHGIAQIQAGNLEMGLYDFALAEDIAPLDADAESFRSWSKMYLNAGSWWGVNWMNASDQFATLYGMVPTLRDSSGISVTERYARSLEGYGDYLQQTFDWCNAVPQYEKALSIYNIPGLADRLPQARDYCANPPATPTPTADPNAPTPTPEP